MPCYLHLQGLLVQEGFECSTLKMQATRDTETTLFTSRQGVTSHKTWNLQEARQNFCMMMGKI